MTSTLHNAVSVLRGHGVVGMPTETVYGLAADARSDVAVAKVFALKGRPSTNPLIVHVASVEVAERYAVLDDRARLLFATFSPGPLTIVLPSRGAISKLVTAGLDTVGIRIPDHPLALELLRAFDGPLAAPSANKSNHVSPTTAYHIEYEFGDAIPVLDGGPCRVGIESTVLSLAAERPTILRPGSVSRDAIEAIIGPVEVFDGQLAAGAIAASPGQQDRHYAPRSRAFRVTRKDIASFRGSRGAHLIVLEPLSPDQAFRFRMVRVLSIGGDPSAAARSFYAALRELDDLEPPAIFIEFPPDEARWTALRDRITRATRPRTLDR